MERPVNESPESLSDLLTGLNLKKNILQYVFEHRTKALT